MSTTDVLHAGGWIQEADFRTMVELNEHSASRWLAHLHTTFTWVVGDSPDAILSISNPTEGTPSHFGALG